MRSEECHPIWVTKIRPEYYRRPVQITVNLFGASIDRKANCICDDKEQKKKNHCQLIKKKKFKLTTISCSNS